MLPLNLPSYEYKIKKEEGKLWIFDTIRKKYIVLFPEEWVRQHFINFMIVHHHYPKSLLKVEGGLLYNERKKRSDIVVFDRSGKAWMVVECKAPDVPITHETFFQATVYNQTLKAPFVVLTNGIQHVIGQIDRDGGKATFLDALPPYDVL